MTNVKLLEMINCIVIKNLSVVSFLQNLIIEQYELSNLKNSRKREREGGERFFREPDGKKKIRCSVLFR